MSAFGPKRTWRLALHMSAFGGKADIGRSHGPFQNKGLIAVVPTLFRINLLQCIVNAERYSRFWKD